MNYCDPDSFIGNFAPASGGGGGTGTLDTKNIDCVSLESDEVICDHLTIDGQDVIPLLASASQAILYQSTTAIPQSTNFAGRVFVSESLSTPNVVTDNIASLTPATDITVGSCVFVGTVEFGNTVYIRTITTTNTNPTLLVLQPNATTNTTQTIQIGKSVATNNYAQLKFNYLLANSTTNYAELSVGTNPGLQVYPSYVNIPSLQEIRVQGTTMWPKRNVYATNAVTVNTSNIANLSFSSAYTFSTINNPKHVVLSFHNLEINNSVNTPIIRLCYNSNSDYSGSPANFLGQTTGTNGTNMLSWGNNASNYNGAGIPLWQRNWPGTGWKAYGKVEMVLMSMSTSGNTITGQIWAITGNVCAIKTSDGSKFMNTLAGTMVMDGPTAPAFRYCSVQFQNTPVGGIMNLMHN